MVDEASEDFEIQGYLYASWRDERLAGRPDRAGGVREIDPDRIWSPRLVITNQRTFHSYGRSVFYYPDGTVYSEEHFSAVLSNHYALRRFPFDTQSLAIVVQAYVSPTHLNDDPVDFAPQTYATGVSPETYLSAWEIERIGYSHQRRWISHIRTPVQQAQFDIIVKRRSGFYVWKVFLPMLLMVMVPWTVFWIKAEEFDWQMKIPITTMLAMIAFEFAIARDLPRVSYLTFLDAVFIASFVFTFVAIAEVITVHFLISQQMRSLAVRIHHSSRWAFPLVFGMVLLVLVPLFFLGLGRPN